MSGVTVLSARNRYRSSSITAVGVIAIICGGFSLLVSLMCLIYSGDLSFSRTISLCIGALMLLGGAFGIATGIGLINRTNWARLSAIAFAIVLVSPGNVSSFRTNPFGFILDLVFAVVALWALVVLSRPSTDAEFSVSQEQMPPPAAISAVAWLLLFSVLNVPFVLFLRAPTLFFGYIESGWSGTLANAFLSLWGFVSGLALLRRKVVGLWLALGLQLYGVCNVLILAFNPAVGAGWYKAISQTLYRIGLPMSDLPSQLSNPAVSFITPMVITACLLVFWDEYRESVTLSAGPNPPKS